MPIYEFVCKPCGEKFELLIRSDRIDQARCPKCGAAELRRVYSTFASPRSDGSSGGSDGCAGCSSGNCSSCGV